MDEVVSVKMTAAEFDLIRRAVERFSDERYRQAMNRSSHIAVQRAAREDHVKATDLLKKLGR